MRKRVRQTTVSGMMIVFGILLSMIFHLIGPGKLGTVFLPMHICVFTAGFILGPVYSGLVGLLTPALSTLILSMPSPERLPFMMLELATYGIVTSIMFHRLKFNKVKFGTYISLLTSMLAGRVVYAAGLFVAADILGIQCGGAFAAVTATITGLPGIAVQLILIPAITYSLKRSGYTDGLD